MKLWDKGYSIDQIVEKFTIGKDRELDLKLAKYDVQGTIAHVKMLQKIGLLSKQELKQVLLALKEILHTIEEGDFLIEPEFEDIHSKIEALLTQKTGDAGKKVHTARSRNDQVLVDLHLYSKEELGHIRQLVKQLFDTFLGLSEKYKEVLMPGYTHLQVAMPSSFGLWFGAYAEQLVDDLHMLNAAYDIADQNPLGSAAGYGSSFPIDRNFTTEELGFKTLKYNVIAAQMSRGKLEKSVGFALSSLAGTISKFSMDVCLYMSQNFDFIRFPDALTTGSSIMPHKKNPDVFELVRAKCNKMENLPVEISAITGNLPSGYHRDFQIIKESYFAGIENMKQCLEVTRFMLQHIQINKDILSDPIYKHIYSVEDVNRLVMEGVSFRDAYQTIGKQIVEGNYDPDTQVQHAHAGSLGNLCLAEIRNKFMMAYGQP
ncbi:MAG: argininosuccinate lyase [Fulvivirga sp.]|nr:argininosuccinate lyase [Fulvivirga sp.]